MHATVVNHLQSCYLGHSHRLFYLTFTRGAGNLSCSAWPPWLKGRLPRWWKPSVWWRGRRKEWVRAIMRYLTHRWAFAKVELNKNGEWHNPRATALEKQALAQSRVLKKVAVEVGWVLLYAHNLDLQKCIIVCEICREIYFCNVPTARSAGTQRLVQYSMWLPAVVRWTHLFFGDFAIISSVFNDYLVGDPTKMSSFLQWCFAIWILI